MINSEVNNGISQRGRVATVATPSLPSDGGKGREEEEDLRPLRRFSWVVIRGLFLFLSSSLATQAENWPQFRGPTGQGISTETGLPRHWSATSNVVWKTEIPGEGWSSPVVFGDRVFVTTTTESGVNCRVISVERKTGKVIWDKAVFEQVPRRKEGKNSYATPTPVVDDNRVYAVFGDGSMVALSHDGSIAWTNREVKFYSRHGLGASPVRYRNLLIMPFDGSNPIDAAGNYPQVSNEERLGWQIPWDKSFIAAVKVESGRRFWTAQRGMSRIAHVSPLILNVDGKDQLISGAGDRLQGFDFAHGELIWSIYAQGEGVAPSPVAGDGLVFAASGFEKTTLRAVRVSDGKGDVTQTHIVWEQRKGVPTLSSLLYVKPYLYAITDGGIATCYKGESGEIVYQERVGGNHSASPVYADGKIHFLSEAGETTVLEPGPEFKILAKNPLNEKCQASIAVSQKQFFIRSDKSLYCIGTGAK